MSNKMHSESVTLSLLGIRLTKEQMSSEISERIRCARRWCRRHCQLLCDPAQRRRAKFQLYKSFIRPILTFGCEVWILDDRIKKRLQRFEMEILFQIYKSKYPLRDPKRLKPNKFDVFAKFKDKGIVEHVTNDRSNWEDLLCVEERALKKRDMRRRCVHWWDNRYQPKSKPVTSKVKRPHLSPFISPSRTAMPNFKKVN